MASLLWKGASIEPIIGPVAFVMMLVYLLAVGQLLYIAAGILLLAAGYDGVFFSCAVGFSGVLFGLKAILNAFSPATTLIWGCSVPTKYAAWAELVVIQLITPHASMTGHACGILAGLSYIYVEPMLRRALLASGVQGAALGGTVQEAAAANPQGAAGMGHAGGGMGMGMGMGGFHPVFGGGMGHLRRGLYGGGMGRRGGGMGGIMGPLAGLFGMGGGWGGGQPGPEFAERHHAGGGHDAPHPQAQPRPQPWRGEYAGQAQAEQGEADRQHTPPAPGTPRTDSYASRRAAAQREGAEALLRRRGAGGVFAAPSAGPAVGGTDPPLSDAELARQLQAEEDAQWG